MIAFFTQDLDYTLENPEKITLWLGKCAESEGFELSEVNIIFTSDPYLLEMNQKHLNHDFYTDIITFDYSEGKAVSGELFISVDRVRENAQTEGVSIAHELSRVMVHGLLHLMGYKDKSAEDQVVMRGKEDFYLNLQKI